ncbi:hypothetical protein F441_14902, partial [Phytophthora nicotianae CJ01A1]
SGCATLKVLGAVTHTENGDMLFMTADVLVWFVASCLRVGPQANSRMTSSDRFEYFAGRRKGNSGVQAPLRTALTRAALAPTGHRLLSSRHRLSRSWPILVCRRGAPESSSGVWICVGGDASGHHNWRQVSLPHGT